MLSAAQFSKYRFYMFKPSIGASNFLHVALELIRIFFFASAAKTGMRKIDRVTCSMPRAEPSDAPSCGELDFCQVQRLRTRTLGHWILPQYWEERAAASRCVLPALLIVILLQWKNSASWYIFPLAYIYVIKGIKSSLPKKKYNRYSVSSDVMKPLTIKPLKEQWTRNNTVANFLWFIDDQTFTLCISAKIK